MTLNAKYPLFRLSIYPFFRLLSCSMRMSLAGRSILPFCLFTLLPLILSAQVQVSKEPFHKKVMENNYFRLLDVWLKPGDTTQFHIHSKPSVFIQFTNTLVSAQLKGQNWTTGSNVSGNVIYKDYAKDSITHRVTNADTGPFHVTDMELLSPYKSKFPFHALPYQVLLENENIMIYQLDAAALAKQINSVHGPMLAELVNGTDFFYHELVKKKDIGIKPGKYLYIPPGDSFYFSAKEGEEINLVLIEIK